MTRETIAAAVRGIDDADLRRRPAEGAWSATEIVCHLRDVDELFRLRFHTILALDDPPILVVGATADDLAAWRVGGAVGHPLDPDRWAEDRQYTRADAAAAVATFGRRRGELVTFLRGLGPREWERAGVHLHRGRLPLSEWAASLARHDDNHLDQLQRALRGRA
jgi:uncharacterized damage-inducible protein DinB